jgi:4-hydroxy 2-oxovalerate aldolase
MPRWAVAAPCRPTHVRRDNNESFSLLSGLLKIKIRHIRSTLEWIKAAADVIRHAKITTLLLPGIGTVPDLKAAYNAGARVVRIDTHCTETDVSKQHIEYARELGMDTAGFLMMSHMIPDEQLAAQAKLMESYGATRVYMADSGGAMNMQDIRDRVRAFKAVLKPETETGMHAHHNLSPREADSITAAATGSTPALRAVRRWRCSLLPQNASVGTTVPTGTLMVAADDIVRPLQVRPVRVDRETMALVAEVAAQKYGSKTLYIRVELGKRRIVGGAREHDRRHGPGSASTVTTHDASRRQS